MSRPVALAVLAAVVVVGLAAIRPWDGDDPVAEGCDGVRTAFERVAFVEAEGAVPDPDVYAGAARQVRDAAATAGDVVAPSLHQLADAYGEIAGLLRGLDPEDPGTYGVIEDRAGEIERHESAVDRVLPAVESWLEEACA